MNDLLIRDVTLELDGSSVEVLVRRGRVIAIADPGTWDPSTQSTLDGAGGVVLPGLRDDHVHLGAWLRAQRSVQIPPDKPIGDLENKLRQAGPSPAGWYVAFGLDHHHSVDEASRRLEAMPGPSMLVHRTGRGAMVNSTGRRVLGINGSAPLVQPRGLWRRVLGRADRNWEAVQLGALRRDLLGQGVVALRDATPYPAGAESRVAFLREHLAPIRLDFMGCPEHPVSGASHRKVLHPEKATLLGPGPPPAVHAVDADQIVAGVAMTRSQGGRLEHAAVCPQPVAELVASSGLAVCANPGFLATRVQALALLRDSGEAGFFQPIAELMDLGVDVSFGSDAPVSPPGVAATLAGACRRGQDEAPFPGRPIAFKDAVRALGVIPWPGSHAWIGSPADLVLMPGRVLENPGLEEPRAIATVIRGRTEHLAERRAVS